MLSISKSKGNLVQFMGYRCSAKQIINNLGNNIRAPQFIMAGGEAICHNPYSCLERLLT